MSFVIQTQDNPPSYYSDDRSIHPAGAWVEREKALQFNDEKSARDYLKNRLPHQAEMCKVVPA